MYRKSVFLIIFLTGCSTLHAPETVYVPVHVPCVSSIPDKPVSVFKDGSVFDQVKALLIDRENAKIYASQLEAQLEGCK